MSTDLRKYIRSIKDFPIKGIMFRDITTLLKEPFALNEAIAQLQSFTDGIKIDKVVGIESRGFIFGSLLANRINAGFVPIRKPGKLPSEKESQTYELEYGIDKIEIHKDAITPGENILIHDDLLATGGTAEASCRLVEKLGGRVVQLSFVVELTFLNGRERLKDYDIRSIIKYDSED